MGSFRGSTSRRSTRAGEGLHRTTARRRSGGREHLLGRWGQLGGLGSCFGFRFLTVGHRRRSGRLASLRRHRHGRAISIRCFLRPTTEVRRGRRFAVGHPRVRRPAYVCHCAERSQFALTMHKWRADGRLCRSGNRGSPWSCHPLPLSPEASVQSGRCSASTRRIRTPSSLATRRLGPEAR